MKNAVSYERELTVFQRAKTCKNNSQGKIGQCWAQIIDLFDLDLASWRHYLMMKIYLLKHSYV